MTQNPPCDGVRALRSCGRRSGRRSRASWKACAARSGPTKTCAAGKERVFVSHSFDELPAALIKARIAAGLSQKDLAERLGLKEQQVQKYEATDYTSASLERVRAVIRALGVSVKEEVSLAGRGSIR